MLESLICIQFLCFKRCFCSPPGATTPQSHATTIEVDEVGGETFFSEVKTWKFYLIIKEDFSLGLDFMVFGSYTPPKTNMEPEKDGFQKESPFPGVHFQVPY